MQRNFHQLIKSPSFKKISYRCISITKNPYFPHAANCSCCSPNSEVKKFSSFDTFVDEGAHVSSHVKTLLENNRKWVEKSMENPNFLNNLKSPQQPHYLYFGCSDSRVPANEILGLGPGEVFVHRNIGNLVLGNDLNALAVLEYAVGHLDVKDIIVTGHYNCGAVRAATARQDLGTLENWLRMIRDVYRLHKEYLDLIYDPERKHSALVELNVIEQCLNIFKTGIVQRKRLQVREQLMQDGMTKEEARKHTYPRIHGLVFDFNTGLLKSLPVDFGRRVGSLDHIYGLYDTRKKN